MSFSLLPLINHEEDCIFSPTLSTIFIPSSLQIFTSGTSSENLSPPFAKIDEHSNKIRLSIEGSQVLKDQIKKNIFEIPEELLENWMKGQELNVKTGKKGFLIMKYKDNFLGSGKASENKIGNFIPKNRRLKEKN